MQNNDLAVIVVVYGDYHNVIELLAGQPEVERVQWVLVDNTPAIRRQDLRKVIGGRSDVTVVHPQPENPGYFGGAQFALDHVPALRTSRFVVVANADTRFNAIDMASSLLDLERSMGENFMGVGAIAPQLTDASGRPVRQPHLLRSPSPDRLARIARMYERYFVTVLHRLGADFKRALRHRFHEALPRQIFAPHGALMIFTPAYLAKTDGFRHPAFLFGEEFFVGMQCANAGLLCIFEPAIKYSHSNHGAMKSIPSRAIARYLREGHEVMAAYARRFGYSGS